MPNDAYFHRRGQSCNEQVIPDPSWILFTKVNQLKSVRGRVTTPTVLCEMLLLIHALTIMAV